MLKAQVGHLDLDQDRVLEPALATAWWWLRSGPAGSSWKDGTRAAQAARHGSNAATNGREHRRGSHRGSHRATVPTSQNRSTR